MRKNTKKRRGGISTVVIEIILVIVVLAAIPIFKGISNSNAQAANKGVTTFNNYSTSVSDFVNANSGGSTENPFN